MKMAQVAKRIFLLVAVNVLVMLTISVVLSLLRVNRYFPQGGLTGLAVVWFCGSFYFAGAVAAHGQMDDGRAGYPTGNQ